MKNIYVVSVLSLALLMSGCTTTGGLAMGSQDDCNVGVSSAVGSFLGAAAGYAISRANGNSSAQNNRAIAMGALAGGALSAATCLSINAKTVEKKSAVDVENQYKKSNGILPSQTKVQYYTATLSPGSTVSANNNVSIKSDLLIIEGKNDPLNNLQETLVLKDSNGKVLKTITKEITQSGSYGSGEFENSFTWKFPTSVSKGSYTIETNLYVNGTNVANNIKSLKLI